MWISVTFWFLILCIASVVYGGTWFCSCLENYAGELVIANDSAEGSLRFCYVVVVVLNFFSFYYLDRIVDIITGLGNLDICNG